MTVVSGETLWVQTLKLLQNRENKPMFETWLAASYAESFDGNDLVISVPTILAMDKIKELFSDALDYALHSIVGKPVNLVLRPRPVGGSSATEEVHPRLVRSDEPLPPRFNPRYTFETFVIGDKNKLAHAAAIAVSELPAQRFNPFFLYGGVGLGKTHLMHAIGQRTLELSPATRVMYITTETFVREFVNALQTNKVDEFRDRYRTVDLLLVDDIQFITGKESTQEEFFHTFNSLYGDHKQIVITSDRSPKDIPDLGDRLRSRFSGGLLIDIKPPDFETRVAILRRKAKAEGIDIPEEAIHFVAAKIENNVRELEGALIRVVAYSSLTNRDIDTELAEAAIAELISVSKRPLTTLDIQRAVCAHYRITLDEMKSRSRQKDIAYPRQVAMYLSRDITGLSLPKIGQEFGGRDHTTVIHACEKIAKEISVDQYLDHTIRQLKQSLSQRGE